MIRHQQEVLIHRPVEDVFDFVATHSRENHAKWEREVVEVRPVTPGPLRVGSRAVMVRREFGRTTETEYEVTGLEHNRSIAYRHLTREMDFAIAFSFRPEAENTILGVQVAIQPFGPLRLLSPLFRARSPRIGARNLTRIRELLEQEIWSAPVPMPGARPDPRREQESAS